MAIWNLNAVYDAFSNQFQASYVSSLSNTSALSSYTLSNVDVGKESADRTIVCAVSWNGGAVNRLLSTASIGGISATIVQTTDAAGWERSAIIYAEVPTGTTVSVVLNFNGTISNGVAIGVFRLLDVASISAGSFFARNNTSGSYTTSVSVNAGDYVISAFGTGNAVANWTNTTERYSYRNSNDFLEGASTTAESTETLAISVTGSTYGVLTTVVFGLN